MIMKPIMQGWLCSDEYDVTEDYICEIYKEDLVDEKQMFEHCDRCSGKETDCKPLRVTVEKER